MILLLITLLAYTVIKEVIFYYTLQKLVNKIMSRDFHEYQTAQKVLKSPKKMDQPATERPEIAPDDLGILSDFA